MDLVLLRSYYKGGGVRLGQLLSSVSWTLHLRSVTKVPECIDLLCSVLINNVAPSHLKGQVNGVSETLAAALRVVAPVVFSIAFAEFSGKDAQWPFTYHSVFHVAAVWALWELFLCLSLGPDVEERKPSR